MALIIIVTQLRAPAEGRGPSLLEASLSPGLSPGAPPVTRLLPSRAPPLQLSLHWGALGCPGLMTPPTWASAWRPQAIEDRESFPGSGEGRSASTAPAQGPEQCTAAPEPSCLGSGGAADIGPLPGEPGSRPQRGGGYKMFQV